MTATFRIKNTVSRSLFTPAPRGARALASVWEAKAPHPNGKWPVLTWHAR